MKSPVFNIDFMRYRQLFFGLSMAAMVISLIYVFVNGLALGLDFTGGTLVEVQFPAAQSTDAIRKSLEDAEFSDGVVQHFGSDREVLVRMPPQASGDQAHLGDRIIEALRVDFGDVTMVQSSYVGPVVGDELRDDAALALLAALGGIMIYVMFRFTRHFAIAAVIALFHDVVVIFGLFAIFGWTFDLTVLAAVLAIIGYSINDSIVVADRIRENFRNMRRATPIEVVNTSLNQVMTRSIITSVTTQLSVIALLIAGGEALRGFALAMSIGIVFGTYSSIFVVASLLIFMNMRREHLVVPVEEGGKEEGPV